MKKIQKVLANLPKGATPRLFLLAVILAVLPVGIVLVQTAVSLFSRAQLAQPVFYFTPSPTDLANGQTTTLTLRLDPKGTKISGATVKASFPTNLINLASPIDTSASPLSTVIIQPTSPTTANSTGEFTFTIGVPLGGDINLTSPSTDFELAKIPIKAVTAQTNQTANININTTTTQIVNPQGSNVTYTVNNAVININKTTPSGVSLSFSPTISNLPPNRTLNVMLDAGTNKIVAARAEVLFNPALVRLASTPDVSGSPLKQVILVSTLADANANGRVIVALGASPGDTPPTGLFELAKLTFTAATTSNTTASLSYDQAKVQIVDENATALSFTTGGATLQLNSGAVTPTPTSILTSTPTPTPIAGDVVYTFEDIAVPPIGSATAVNGTHSGINFGNGLWVADTSATALNHMAGAFSSEVGSRSFTLPSGKVLKGLILSKATNSYVGANGTATTINYTISDGVNSAKTGTVTYGQRTTLTTGWTQAGSTITVTGNWDLYIDDIAYGDPGTEISPTPPTIGGGYIKLVPQSSTIPVGDTSPIDIRFRTAIVNQSPTPISSIALRLTYPYSQPAPEVDLVTSSGSPATQVEQSSQLLSSGGWSYQINQITRANGKVTVDLALIDTSTTGFASSSEISLGTIRLKASQKPTPNPLTISFDTNETRMLTKASPVTNLLDPLVNGVYTISDAVARFTFTFRMQGVTKSGVQREVDLTLTNGSTTKTYKVTVVSDSTGVFSPVSPVTLSGLPTTAGGTTYDVYVKGPGYLRKLLGSMLFLGATTNTAPASWSSKIVLAGDFDNNNILNIYDVAIHLSHFTQISVPSTHPDYDVVLDLNADQMINLLDIALVLNNYIALTVPGE